jgi:mannitol 2-dehydrogenase
VLPPVPGVDLGEYFQLIERRCLNPKIADTTRRLCFDGSNRQPKFIIPSIADRLERGLPVEGLALESALWCRYCAGVTESGAVIAPNDPNWDRLHALAGAARSDPAAWLAMGDIYGTVAEATAFREAFTAHLRALWADGTEAVLQRYIGSV